MAFISVSDEGENHIVLVAGANNAVRRSDISAMRGLIEESDMIVMQLEIPLEVVKHALELAVGTGKNVILNPAPARDLPAEMLRHVYVLIPNETELQILSGMPTSTEQEIVDAARHLNSLGTQRVIVTMGDRGFILD